MKQRYIVFDTKYCHDCNDCFVACKDEHVGNEWMPYTEEQPQHGPRWMNLLRTERGQYPRVEPCFLAMPCQHCEDAPCINANPDCITRREDGIVLIDPEKARGKKELVESCPYEAIYWNEEKNVAQKCTMCAHLMDGNGGWGQEMPRCVHSCPTGALSFYTLEPEEMAKKVAEEKLEHFHPEFNSNPHVYYKNLHRFNRNFIAGDILKDGDCLEGAKVSLKGDVERPVQETNFFGDFKFDDLDAGTYTIVVNGVDMKTVTIEESLNVGDISID